MTDKELKLFKDLHGTELGKTLVEYFEHLKVELFNPSVVTIENFLARKEAIEILDKHFIEKIKLQNPDKDIQKNQFQ